VVDGEAVVDLVVGMVSPVFPSTPVVEAGKRSPLINC
jgi:hypothetical protein